ncbi:hypothetical protein B0H13DRAFT_2306602 [Mycena leptocephala]|nr:hypothetical protein B0H13DRAFT_2306602 [Mycena leptocephala]
MPRLPLPAGLEIIDGLDDEASLGWEFASDDGSDESEPEEYWGQLQPPMTWEERMEWKKKSQLGGRV